MIGDNIKALRVKAGLTQKDLADKLFVTSQAVSRWENGEVEPSVTTLSSMAEIFNVSIDEICGREVEKPQPEIITETKYVYDEAPKQVLALCEKCNKPIYDVNEINRFTTHSSHRRGRHHHGVNTSHIYCKECNEKRLEELRIQAEKNRQETIAKARKRRVWSYVLSVLILAIWIGVSAVKCQNTSMLYLNIALAVAASCFVSCCLLNNNFILYMSATVFTWGFVKWPGLIFSLDLDGIIWLLTVKLAMWILGFLIGAGFLALALALGFVCALFVYPFALVKSYKNPGDVEF